MKQRDFSAIHPLVHGLRALAMLLALVLTISYLPVFELHARAAQSGMVRVLISRLGSSNKSVTFKTTCAYYVNGDSSNKIASGASATVSASSAGITLKVNGATRYSGESLTLCRAKKGDVGVRFTSPALSNTYCGDLLLSKSSGYVRVVLRAYVEDYLKGVVAYEMSDSFPLEALKAQAVAARTYVMRYKKGSGAYDVTDTTKHQVFKGLNTGYTNVIKAVEQTAGTVLMWNGSYAQCYYTASNGGQTELTKNIWGGTLSYMPMKDDTYDRENPSSIVKSHIIYKQPTSQKPLNSKLKAALIASISQQLENLGLKTSATSVTINKVVAIELQNPRYDSPSRTYQKAKFTLQLTGTDAKTGAKVTPNTTFAATLSTYGGLESMLGLSINSGSNEIIDVEESADAFTLCFRRYGHGVGMSQRGAQWMAKQYGKDYRFILNFYYEGAALKTIAFEDETMDASSQTPAPTSTPSPTPTPDAGEAESTQYRTLKKGCSGQDVLALQKRLKTLGYFTGSPAGNFGTLTVQAVCRFQKAFSLAQDGIATPALQQLIFSEDALNPPKTGVYAQLSRNLTLRARAKDSSKALAKLKKGEVVCVLARKNGWAKVEAGGYTGFIRTKYLKRL